MLKPLVPKSRSHLFVRLKDIAENQASGKLKPIVGTSNSRYDSFDGLGIIQSIESYKNVWMS